MSDERLDRILTAAYACFTRHGARRTTMEDIGREAGISRPAVYQHVRNIEDAFRRLTERMLDDALAEARDAAGASVDPTDHLTGVLQAKLGLALLVAGLGSAPDTTHSEDTFCSEVRPYLFLPSRK